VFFRVDWRCEGEVSAHADSMAVRGVQDELVSGGCGFSISVRPGIIEFSLLDLDRLMLDASPDPDEESVSY
jgi:hypothetical protein